MYSTRKQMWIGGTTLVIGWLVLFAMVLELLPQFIWLYMVAYGVTIVGFMIGMFGVMTHIRQNIDKNRQD